MAWFSDASTSATCEAVRLLAGMSSKVAWQVTTGSMPAGTAGNTRLGDDAAADVFTTVAEAVVAAGLGEEDAEVDGLEALVTVLAGLWLLEAATVVAAVLLGVAAIVADDWSVPATAAVVAAGLGGDSEDGVAAVVATEVGIGVASVVAAEVTPGLAAIVVAGDAELMSGVAAAVGDGPDVAAAVGDGPGVAAAVGDGPGVAAAVGDGPDVAVEGLTKGAAGDRKLDGDNDEYGEGVCSAHTAHQALFNCFTSSYMHQTSPHSLTS